MGTHKGWQTKGAAIMLVVMLSSWIVPAKADSNPCAKGETYFPAMTLPNGEYIPSFCAPVPNATLECGVKEAAWGLGLGIVSLVAGLVALVPTAGASSVVAWAGAVGTATAAGGVYLAFDCWIRMS